MRQVFYLLPILILLTHCKSKQNFNCSTNERRDTIKNDYQPKFWVKSNTNEYVLVDVKEDSKPLPAQGQKEMIMDMYRALKYPASAREKGIQGMVVLLAEVNRNGKVENVTVVQGVTSDMDKAAIDAYTQATLQGYQAYYYAEAIVGFQLEIPVKFRLR